MVTSPMKHLIPQLFWDSCADQITYLSSMSCKREYKAWFRRLNKKTESIPAARIEEFLFTSLFPDLVCDCTFTFIYYMLNTTESI